MLSLVGIGIFIFASDLVFFFLKETAEGLSIGTDFLKTLTFSLGFMGVQFALTGIFRAAGNMHLTLILGIISMFGLQLPLAYLFSHYQFLGFGNGIEDLWRTFPITNVIMAGICIIIYAQGNWKKKRLIGE